MEPQMHWTHQQPAPYRARKGGLAMTRTGAAGSLVGLSMILALALSPPTTAQTPIRVGATMSQTGAYSTQGAPARNGYLLCQKHVNAKGGLLGRKIEFLIYDDQSDIKT